MDIFWQVITAIGSSTVLFLSMAFLTRSIITHWLSKDIEKYKINLQAESQKELVRIQASLQLLGFEHQVRFSQLHERKVSIISEMYSHLVLLHRTAINFVQYYQSVRDHEKNAYLNQLWEAADRHNEYFDRHRIYFQEELCKKVDNFGGKLSEACSALASIFVDKNAIKVHPHEVWELWNKAMEAIEREVPVIRRLLEESFRKELGVFLKN